jgi:HAMP domain-containing protein
MRKYYSSLRGRLLLLLFSGCVAFIGLAVYHALVDRAASLSKASEDVLQTADVIAAEDNHIIDRTNLFIEYLVQDRTMRELVKTAKCNTVLATMMEKTPDIDNVAIFLPDGQIICSVSTTNLKINIADSLYFQKALTKAPNLVVGDPIVSRISGRWGIPLYKAIVNKSGQVEGVARALFNLSWLSNKLGEARLPKDSKLMVVDSRGTILARYPDPQQWMGKHIPQTAMLQRMLTENRGVADAQGMDRKPVIVAFTPFTKTSAGRLFLWVSIPREAVTGDVRRAFILNLSIILVIFLLIITAIWTGSEWLFLRPIEALADATRRLSQGEKAARSGLPHADDELGELARSFDGMADSIQAKEKELIRTNRALTPDGT